MNIYDLLKLDNVRISFGDKWLIYNPEEDIWVVYQRKPYSKKTSTLYTNCNESDAISFLISED